MHLQRPPFSSHSFFPNLVFGSSVVSVKGFQDSRLLDFLEASPTLRAMRMMILGDVSPEDVPRERVAARHNIENLSGRGRRRARLQTHKYHARARKMPTMTPSEILVPRIGLVERNRLLVHEKSPIEEVTLKTANSWTTLPSDPAAG